MSAPARETIRKPRPPSAGALLAPLLLVCLPLTSLLGPAGAAVLDPRTVHSDTLHNGLHIVLCRDPDASAISVEIVVRAGAADDPPGQEGISHLLEHVLWAAPRADDPRRRIEDFGGQPNAGTLRDFTRFYATVPAGHLELAVSALAELILAPTFHERTVLRERSIIREESASRLDNPRALLNDLAFEEVFQGVHPYSRPIDGAPYSLDRLDPIALSLFYQTWYVPNNMAVIIVGDVTFDDARAAVTSTFGHLSPAALPPRTWPPVPRPPAGRSRVVTTPFREAYVIAAFVGPAAGEHREVCASDLLAALLAQGASGRLLDGIAGSPHIATNAGVDFLTQRDRALFGVWAACDPENIPAAQDAIRAELRRLAGEPITPDELAGARRRLLAAYAFANETPADRATTLAFYEAIDTYRSATQYPPRIRLLTSADLASVAAWYAAEPVWIILTPEAVGQ